MRAIELRTDDLINPIGLASKQPRLSWKCAGGQQQTRYRVTAVNDDGRQVDDSGEIAGNDMFLSLQRRTSDNREAHKLAGHVVG